MAVGIGVDAGGAGVSVRSSSVWFGTEMAPNTLPKRKKHSAVMTTPHKKNHLKGVLGS